MIVGSLLYYARAVDATILPAVCALACDQAAPTLDTMVAAERLLGYVAKFPLATITFFPSDMLLLPTLTRRTYPGRTQVVWLAVFIS